MTHLPFIAGSYALGILVPAGFALSAYLRLSAARRRLAVIDPRAKGPGAGSRARPGSDSGGRPGSDTDGRSGAGLRARGGTTP